MPFLSVVYEEAHHYHGEKGIMGRFPPRRRRRRRVFHLFACVAQRPAGFVLHPPLAFFSRRSRDNAAAFSYGARASRVPPREFLSRPRMRNDVSRMNRRADIERAARDCTFKAARLSPRCFAFFFFATRSRFPPYHLRVPRLHSDIDVPCRLACACRIRQVRIWNAYVSASLFRFEGDRARARTHGTFSAF